MHVNKNDCNDFTNSLKISTFDMEEDGDPNEFDDEEKGCITISTEMMKIKTRPTIVH